MENSQSQPELPELIAQAQVTAKTFEDQIAALRSEMAEAEGSETQLEALQTAIVGLESLTVDSFTLFEARMQRHFKRGPFSRKLKAALLEAGEPDLAGRVQNYYLAVNVLKHGKGASYRTLLAAPNSLFDVHNVESVELAEGEVQRGLVDISAPGFFDALANTLLEARTFLENR